MEFYPQYGDGFGETFIPRPALQVTHADGNLSTDLIYVKHSTEAVDTNITLTRVEMKDPAYPFFVTVCLQSYRDEDMIEEWTEIHHEESGPVVLNRYASCAPLLQAKEYWLTSFHGDYAHEAALAEEKLGPGLKVLDSHIGVRATRYCLPSFVVSLDGPASEESGQAVGGSLEWSGSFEIAFELDPRNRLRALCGINPLGEESSGERTGFQNAGDVVDLERQRQRPGEPEFSPLGLALRHPGWRQAASGAVEQLGGDGDEL